MHIKYRTIQSGAVFGPSTLAFLRFSENLKLQALGAQREPAARLQVPTVTHLSFWFRQEWGVAIYGKSFWKLYLLGEVAICWELENKINISRDPFAKASWWHCFLSLISDFQKTKTGLYSWWTNPPFVAKNHTKMQTSWLQSRRCF